jgi:hypothetical protein
MGMRAEDILRVSFKDPRLFGWRAAEEGDDRQEPEACPTGADKGRKDVPDEAADLRGPPGPCLFFDPLT